MKYIERDILILLYVFFTSENSKCWNNCIMHPKIIVYHKRVTCSITLQEKFSLNYNAFLNPMNN